MQATCHGGDSVVIRSSLASATPASLSKNPKAQQSHSATLAGSKTRRLCQCVSRCSFWSNAGIRRLQLPPNTRQICRKQRCKVTASALVSPGPDILSAIKLPLGRDTAAMLFSLVGAVVWVKLFDFLARHQVFERKLSRKLVHITAGPLFLLTWPLFSWDLQARYYAAVIPALQALRLIAIGTGVLRSPNTVRAVSREGDRQELLRGPLYYVLILAAVTIGCWRSNAAGFLIVALMCGGDGLADIFGRRFGSVKLPYNGSKSWAGSFAMFTGSLAMASAFVLLFGHLGLLALNLDRAFPAMTFVAAAATVTESLPINQVIDDNLSVPAITALLGIMCLTN